MNIPKISAKFITTLAKKVAAEDTTATLTSIKDLDLDNLPSGRYGFTIDEGNSNIEYVEADVSGTSLSNVKRLDPTTLAETTGFVKEHRAGAEVKVTDYTVLGRIRAVLLGEDALDGGAPLYYDSAPTLTDPEQLATVAYVLATANGGAVSFDNQVWVGDAGETISTGEWVYFKESDGLWYKTDANDATKCKNVRIGMAKGAGTAGNAISSGVFAGGLEKTGTYAIGQKYYLSNTAGELSTSPGEFEVLVGIGDNNGELVFLNLYDPEAVTQEEKDALVGTVGTPSETNKYVTENNLSIASTDQTQTTQDSALEIGEADATTKKNKIAQSFIPTKEKISGVMLYKLASTNDFTGTLKVALQADSSGSPDGSDLASITLDNVEYVNFAVGEFEAKFSSEYSSLVCSPQTTYWIVITTSTSDNSNHPNLGFNTAGGYANGTLKYYNTTNGWVEITGDDLYFKTLEGINNQVVKTDSAGAIPKKFFDRTKMPLALYQQRLATDLSSGSIRAFYTPPDGSYFLVAFSGNVMQKFVRDSSTGFYRKMYSVSCSSTTKRHGLVVVGSYVYEIFDNGTNLACNRYDLADLANQTSMTVPTVAASSSPDVVAAWTDGIYIYVITTTSGTTSRKWSISGTVLTEDSTATVPGFFNGDDHSSIVFAKDKWYLFNLSATWTSTTYRTFALADGSDLTGTTAFKLSPGYSDAFSGAIMIPTDTDSVFYFGAAIPIYDETAQVQANIIITPITLS